MCVCVCGGGGTGTCRRKRRPPRKWLTAGSCSQQPLPGGVADTVPSALSTPLPHSVSEAPSLPPRRSSRHRPQGTTAAPSPCHRWFLRGALSIGLSRKRPPPTLRATGLLVFCCCSDCPPVFDASEKAVCVAVLPSYLGLNVFLLCGARDSAAVTAAVVLLSNLFSILSCSVSLSSVLVPVLACC
jgi:hypothetical protein